MWISYGNFRDTLFNETLSFGLPRASASLIFSIYGFFTTIGSALSGVLCNYVNMKILLGSIYASRVLLALILIVLPKTFIFICIFVIFLGLTSDSTVSPTSGLVLDIFGIKQLPTLFGMAFLVHQIGCFVSAWLGGILVEIYSNYVGLWIFDAILGLFAATVSYSITYRSEIYE